MTKNVKRNVVVSAIMAIMLCVSLIAGATFALFTSESKVNIAVNSGKVSVIASIDENSVQTKELYDTDYSQGADNMFESKATFGVEGLTLEKFVPGDGIKFNIVVKNESTVSVKYRTIISCEVDNGLFAGLDVTIGDKEGYNGMTVVADWADLAVGTADAIVPVVVELPEGAGNDYQDKTCTISYKVEAIQGNARVENPEDGVLYIWNVYDLKNFRNAVNSGTTFSGKTVKLAANIDLNNEEWTPIGTWNNTFDGTFDGQGFIISNLYINAPETDDVALFGVATDATIKNINVHNVNVTGYNNAATIVASPYTGCTISNCHVTGSVNIVAEYAYAGGIATYGYIKAIDNCSVIPTGTGTIMAKERNAVGGIMAWTLEDTNGVISNCKVKDLELTGWANIGSIVGFVHRTNSIVGCTAENIVITKTRDGGNATLGYVAGGWSYTSGKKITISNNTIKNVELNGNYVAKAGYLKGVNVMFGAEYDGNASADTSIVVMENNVLENVVDNRYCKVTNDAELASAITDGAIKLCLTEGTFHMPNVAKGKTLTIAGASKNTIIEVVPSGKGEAGGQLDYSLDGSTVTFNNLTIKTNSQLYAGFARLSATYNGCVIQNTYNLSAGNSEFNDCTFNITNEYLRVGGAYGVAFNRCIFNTDGRAILVFQDGTKNDQTVTIKDCTFNATAAAKTWNGIHVAAVSYDGSQGGKYTVNFEGNNVVDTDFNGLWQIKAGEANVTVNGIN